MSSYVDGRLSGKGRSDPDPSWEDLAELFALARELAALDLPPPAEFQSTLLRALRGQPDEAPSAAPPRPVTLLARFRAQHSVWLPARLVPAAVALFLAAFAALVLLRPNHTVSASEILRRSDQELSRLLQPGSILYRRVSVTTVRARPGERERRNDQVVDQWADGSQPGRVAARAFSPDGVVLWSYVTEREEGHYRPHIYFTPAYSFNPDDRATLSIRPSRDEVQAALDRLPAGRRAQLADVRVQAFVYVPILNDWYQSTAMLAGRPRAGHDLVAPPRLSVTEIRLADGKPGYQIDGYDSSRVMLQTNAGRVVAMRGEYRMRALISRDWYLPVRVTTDWLFPDGAAWTVTHTTETVENRHFAVNAPSPFEQRVPPGTRVVRWTAEDELAAIADMLTRR